jgi:hypothetical protein
MKSCRWKLLLGAAALMGAVGLAAPPVWADIRIDTFEMDGNTADDGDTDWDTEPPVPPFIIHTEIIDSPNPGGLQMTQGTKDIHDIGDWVFKTTNNTTPKDDLQLVQVTAILDVTEGPIAYFGAERLSVNGGTTSFGFWVFGSNVDIDLGPPVDGDSFSDDAHTEGDGLIVVDVGGSAIEGIRVFQWQSGALIQIADAGAAECSDFDMGGDFYETDVCGEVSDDGLFVEVAADLNDLFGNLCISAAMATTRTSNTPQASVKNFILFEEFDLCSIDVTKVCEVVEILNVVNPSFKVVVDPVIVGNNGSGAFGGNSTIDLVDDAGTSGFLGDDISLTNIPIAGKQSVCLDTTDNDAIVEPIALCTGDATCTAISGDYKCGGDGGTGGFQPGEFLAISNAALMFTSSTNGPTNGIKATINDPDANTSAMATEVFVDCAPIDISPMLYADKTCTTTLKVTSDTTVAVQLDYDGTFCNTGSLPLIIDVDDLTASQTLFEDKTLANGELCLDTVDCTNGGTCFGETAGVCVDGTADGDSCTSSNDTACTNGGGTCNTAGELNGVCVAAGGLLAPSTGLCSGGADAGNPCTIDNDCEGVGVCLGTLQVCETYAGNFLPTQAGEPSDQDGTCMGGLDDGQSCAVDAQCRNDGADVGMCLVDPGTAEFFNKVRVEANDTDNPLLGGTEFEEPSATCALCP